MAFIDDLENKIQAAYALLLNEVPPTQKSSKGLICDSYKTIARKITFDFIGSAHNQGLNVLQTANHIIFQLLNEKFFVHENHRMALFIGMLYLKNRGYAVNHYSIDSITNQSTLADISSLTATW
jgi:prophage maintenance system killer protein